MENLCQLMVKSNLLRSDSENFFLSTLDTVMRRAWKPTPVFLPGESPWSEKHDGLQSIGPQRVRHD